MHPNIFSAARAVLEAKDYTSDQLSHLTKVLLAMGYSYGDINDIRDELKKGNSPGLCKLAIDVAEITGSDRSAFNSFVSAFQKAHGEVTK